MAEEKQGGEAHDETRAQVHDQNPGNSPPRIEPGVERMVEHSLADGTTPSAPICNPPVTAEHCDRGGVDPADTTGVTRGVTTTTKATAAANAIAPDAPATQRHDAVNDTPLPDASSALGVTKGTGQHRAVEKPAANSSAIDFSVPTLKHFATYTRVTSVLEGYVIAAMRENRRLDHILIHGLAGSGTTTLARALVRDYAPNRFEELDALTGVSLPKLKRALMRANRRGVVLIRHVELLDGMSMGYLAAYMSGKPMDAEGGPAAPGSRAPWETDFDREIAASARARTPDQPARERFTPGGTVIATALMPSQLHYSFRSRFEQLVGLRTDPKALRVALGRVLRPHGVSIAPEAFPRAERLLGSLTESTEQLARAVLARAQMEDVQVIDDALMKSIIEEDLANRFPVSHYAASLREHLGGRKVKEATCEEVHRISDETSWGASITRSAITTMIREDRAVQRAERPQTPM